MFSSDPARAGLAPARSLHQTARACRARSSRLVVLGTSRPWVWAVLVRMMIGLIWLLPRLVGFLLPCLYVHFVNLAHAMTPFDAARPYARASWPCGDAFCPGKLICADRDCHPFPRPRFD